MDAVIEGIPGSELTVERVRTEVRALTEKIAAKQVRKPGPSSWWCLPAVGGQLITVAWLFMPRVTARGAADGGIEVSRAYRLGGQRGKVLQLGPPAVRECCLLWRSLLGKPSMFSPNAIHIGQYVQILQAAAGGAGRLQVPVSDGVSEETQRPPPASRGRPLQLPR